MDAAAAAQLEPVQEDELPAIASLVNEAFGTQRWESDPAIFTGTRTSAAGLANELAAHPRGTFLQYKDAVSGIRVGCVMLTPTDEECSNWYLGYLCLGATQQKAGMGAKILSMAESWAKQKGAKVMQLKVVDVRTPLIEWYIRRGYSRTGDEPFPYEEFSTGAMLFQELRLVILQKDL